MRSQARSAHYTCVTFGRRHLPHQYALGAPLFVTFRLYGALPAGRAFRDGSLASGQAFAAMDRILDTARSGPRYLAIPEIAECVTRAMLAGDPHDYCLHSWVIMPNHVHMLVTPESDVSRWLGRLKGVSAREANRIPGRTGRRFWQDESYDHRVRNTEEFQRIESYILRNPVRAGLAASPDAYCWSSVGLKPSAG